MSRVQESLKANLEEIKKNLPEEFHAELEKQISEAQDYSVSAESDEQAIRAELRANPTIDDLAIEANLDFSNHRIPAAPSAEAEFASFQAELQANPDVDEASILPNLTAPSGTPAWH